MQRYEIIFNLQNYFQFIFKKKVGYPKSDIPTPKMFKEGMFLFYLIVIHTALLSSSDVKA